MKNIFLLILIVFFPQQSQSQTLIAIGQSNAVGIIRESNANIIFINCAHDGQSIDKFEVNLDENSFFGDCIKKITASNEKIDGVIFWQGENDAIKRIKSKTWSIKATKVILGLRQFIDNNVPILMVILHDKKPPKNIKYWRIIREMQQNFAGIYKIDSTNYEFEDDNLHLTPNGYIKILDDILIKINGLNP
jgi:hypothetical protein